MITVLLINIFNIRRKGTGGTAFTIASEKSYFDVMAALIINGKPNIGTGWCIDNWIKPCKQIVDSPSVTTNQTYTAPSGGFLLTSEESRSQNSLESI